MALPIKVFYLCAPCEEDERLLDELKKQLQPLKNDGLIEDWERRDVRVGTSIQPEIRSHLNSAQLILLLLSPDLAADSDCRNLMQIALARGKQEGIPVIPVLLRHLFLDTLPVADLLIFPRDGKPIGGQPRARREALWVELARDIEKQARRLAGPHKAVAPSSSTLPAQAAAGRAPALPARCDVLLVTATPVEFAALRQVAIEEMGGQLQRRHATHKVYYYLGTFGGATTWAVESEMGSGGPGGSHFTVTESIRDLAPRAIIMVGIAFGLKPHQQKIGDILVSHQLVSYELQRVGTASDGQTLILPRGDRTTAATWLLGRFKDGAHDWRGAQPHFGLLLSGEKLIDNPAFLEQLRRLEPEAIGGEMEGAGLYAAAHDYGHDWIVVKAICDWGDGHKSAHKEANQQLAALNAARFVFHVLGLGGLAPDPARG
jgi:nucleoside phosphorylase